MYYTVKFPNDNFNNPCSVPRLLTGWRRRCARLWSGGSAPPPPVSPAVLRSAPPSTRRSVTTGPPDSWTWAQTKAGHLATSECQETWGEVWASAASGGRESRPMLTRESTSTRGLSTSTTTRTKLTTTEWSEPSLDQPRDPARAAGRSPRSRAGSSPGSSAAVRRTVLPSVEIFPAGNVGRWRGQSRDSSV